MLSTKYVGAVLGCSDSLFYVLCALLAVCLACCVFDIDALYDVCFPLLEKLSALELCMLLLSISIPAKQLQMSYLSVLIRT